MVRLPPVLTLPCSGTGQESQPATSRLEYLGYALWLAGPLCVMLLSVTMSVGPGRVVTLPGIGPLPETCTVHTQLGIDCPGCGLTRSFIHLAHGRLQAAWSLNFIGPFLFVYVAWQIPLALLSLWAAVARGTAVQSTRSTKTSPAGQRGRIEGWLGSWAQYNQWLLVGLMLALLLRWGLRLVTGGMI